MPSSNLTSQPASTPPVAPVPMAELIRMQHLFNEKKFSQASELGWELLKTNPWDASLLNLLALAEHRQDRHSAAVVLLQRACKADPNGCAHWNDLGNVHGVMRNPEAAEEAYREALRCNPNSAEAHNNLGVLASEREDQATARAYFERAMELRPNYVEAICNLGIVMSMMEKFQKAQKRYEQALALNPDYHKARFNLALTLLLLGDFARGWKEWESRWNHEQLANCLRSFPEPAWTGGPLTGKRILLYPEQGIGDSLQFVRYVPLVAARGPAHIILEVQAGLVPLLESLDWPAMLGGVSMEIVGQGTTPKEYHGPPYDVHCALMGLPLVFRTTLANIPSPQGYIFPPGLSARSGEGRPLRVGLVWGGSVTHKRDKDRSLKLTQLLPLFEVPDVHFVSLQKGPPAAQLDDFAERSRIEDAGAGFDSFADTAACVATLDLVIAVDTSVAHLAGAMGKPVWIIIHHHPDWRWILKRKDSPWYKSARLFRQHESGDWDSAILDMKRELLARVGAAQSSHAALAQPQLLQV